MTQGEGLDQAEKGLEAVPVLPDEMIKVILVNTKAPPWHFVHLEMCSKNMIKIFHHFHTIQYKMKYQLKLTKKYSPSFPERKHFMKFKSIEKIYSLQGCQPLKNSVTCSISLHMQENNASAQYILQFRSQM